MFVSFRFACFLWIWVDRLTLWVVWILWGLLVVFVDSGGFGFVLVASICLDCWLLIDCLLCCASLTSLWFEVCLVACFLLGCFYCRFGCLLVLICF